MIIKKLPILALTALFALAVISPVKAAILPLNYGLGLTGFNTFSGFNALSPFTSFNTLNGFNTVSPFAGFNTFNSFSPFSTLSPFNSFGSFGSFGLTGLNGFNTLSPFTNSFANSSFSPLLNTNYNNSADKTFQTNFPLDDISGGNASGQVQFSVGANADETFNTTIDITTDSLPAEDNYTFSAWLANDATEDTLYLGKLGDSNLFNQQNSLHFNQDLPGEPVYNLVNITKDSDVTAENATSTSEIILQGKMPFWVK
jgi:hypothetical protein